MVNLSISPSSTKRHIQARLRDVFFSLATSNVYSNYFTLLSFVILNHVSQTNTPLHFIIRQAVPCNLHNCCPAQTIHLDINSFQESINTVCYSIIYIFICYSAILIINNKTCATEYLSLTATIVQVLQFHISLIYHLLN